MASRQTGIVTDHDAPTPPTTIVARNLATIGHHARHDPLASVLAAHDVSQRLDAIGYDATTIAAEYHTTYTHTINHINRRNRQR